MDNMDICLQRILSLIPHKPDGKPIKGEYKKFATNIGYDSGTIVALWKNGSSASYKKKLHEISQKYNVSVEWLKGETDNPVIQEQKNPPALPEDGRSYSDLLMETVKLVSSEALTAEQLRAVLAQMKSYESLNNNG